MLYENFKIIFKNNPKDMDVFNSGTYSLDWKDCKVVITNNLIVEEIKDDKVIGHIFDLGTIVRYEGNLKLKLR